MDLDNYIAPIAAALTILVLGCMNFVSFRNKDGQPNYLWVALITFIVTCLTQVLWGGVGYDYV